MPRRTFANGRGHRIVLRNAGGSSLSEITRPTVDDHPQKVRVASVQPADHDPAEGWMDMAVQWIVTRASVGAERVVFGITTFPPNGRHDIHRHPHAEEVEYLVEGEGLARVGDVDVQMRPGDVVFVKTGEAHGFWNTSETERAVLVWCYGGAASLDEAGYVYEPDAAHGLPIQRSAGDHARGPNAQGTNAAGATADASSATASSATASSATAGTLAADAGRDGAQQPDADHAG